MVPLATVGNAEQREPQTNGSTDMATRTTSTTAKKATTVKTPAKKTTAKKTDKKLSQIDAALAVLKKARKPMSCKEMVEAMAKQKLWTSPAGKTPMTLETA